jgi:hypothetical protein
VWHDPLFVAVACSVVLALAYGLNHVFAPRSGAVALTLMLIMLWCAEWAIYSLPRPPNPTWLLAGLDLIGALGAWLCWRQARRTWKEALVGTFVLAIFVQVMRAAGEWSAPAAFGPHTPGSEAFTVARNMLFFAQVVCCGWVGGSRAGAWLLARLPRHSPGHHHLGSGR